MTAKRAILHLVAGAVLATATLVMAAMATDANVAAATTPSLQELMGFPDETEGKAPVDYGAGPGVRPQANGVKVPTSARLAATATSSNAIPSGGSSASNAGVFGAPITWPVIPIHVILLSDGRVMSYGTNSKGQQGAQLIYDIWDPSLGTDTSSHLVLPNSTSTDIFCSAQSLMLSGDVLTSGGDLTVNGARNSANNQTTIFSPSANALTANTPMTYARWYATLVGLPNGQLAIFGGRQNVGPLAPIVSSTTPEIYDPALRTWTSLTGATSTGAFGANWFYPRAFVAPGGKIFVINSRTASCSTSQRRMAAASRRRGSRLHRRTFRSPRFHLRPASRCRFAWISKSSSLTTLARPRQSHQRTPSIRFVTGRTAPFSRTAEFS